MNVLIDMNICDAFCENNATFVSCGMEGTQRLLHYTTEDSCKVAELVVWVLKSTLHGEYSTMFI